MKLSHFLSRHEIHRADFARDVGVSAEAIRRYETGERIPRRKVMMKIVSLTEGAVQAADFYTTEMVAAVLS